jgi:hypothetical protein
VDAGRVQVERLLWPGLPLFQEVKKEEEAKDKQVS